MKKSNVFEQNSTVNNGFIGKVVGISAAAILAVGIPTAIYASKNARASEFVKADAGSYTVSESSMNDAMAAVTEQSAAKPAAAEEETEVKAEPAAKTEKAAKTKKKSAKSAEEKNAAQIPETLVPVQQAAPQQTTAAAVQPAVTEKAAEAAAPAVTRTETVADSVYMSVDKMLSMDAAQLRALSDNEYEIVLSASSQAAYFGFKCKAFPDYVFVVWPSDHIGADEEYFDKSVPVTQAYGDTRYVLGNNEITQLNLYGNAEIGSGVKVGMRCSEIEQILGTELRLQPIESSIQQAAAVEINGRTWYLHFDFTEEQKQQIAQEFQSNYKYVPDEMGNMVLDGSSVWDQSISIDRWDPVCDIAVFNNR